MEIIFAIPISLTLPIAALLLTGHSGAAERINEIVFSLLLLVISWGLAKEHWGIKGSKGDE